MKKSILFWLFLGATLCASAASIPIPAGTILYLDVTNSNWKSNTYFSAYFWNDATDGNYVSMSAVEGQTGIYSVTAPAGKASWANVIFRCHTAQQPAAATGWGTADGGQTADLTWTGENCYSKQRDMFVNWEPPCETEVIAIDTVICNTKLPIDWHGFTFTQAGSQSKSIKYSDGKCDSIRWDYILRTRDCGSDIVHNTISICLGAKQTLTPTNSGDAYEWSTGETTPSITFAPTAVGTYEVTCHVGTVGDVQIGKNIIANGDFEDVTNQCPYNGFTSDYECYSVSEKFDYNKSYRGFYKLDKGPTYKVSPHGGTYMLTCDGDENKKTAWSAKTTEPIVRGKQYRFSYWAANQTTNPAKLTFYIEYNGKVATLIPETELPLEKTWHQYGQDLSWTAPETAASARIYLVDNCLKNSGNDFSLDDIVFQPLFGDESAMVEVFRIVVDDCEQPCPDVKRDSVHKEICDTLLPYTWEGHTFIGPETFERMEKSPRGCDSILHIYHLETISCAVEPDEPDTPAVPDTLEVCIGEPTTLTATTTGDYSYLWSPSGETTQSITVAVDSENATTYTCTVTRGNTANRGNLLTQGGFEFSPSSPVYSGVNELGQTISYYYLNFQNSGKDIPQGSTTTATNANNVKTQYFSHLLPHEGSWLLVCDGSDNSDAQVWSAKNLKLNKGETYAFSCWAANIDSAYASHGSSSLPKLKFVIENGGSKQTLLEFTAPETTGKWAKYEATYTPTADITCNIYIVNYTIDYEGNDFALDDVQFRSTKQDGTDVVATEKFLVVGKDCTVPPEPPTPECRADLVYAKWNDVIFCSNAMGEFVGYQWYKDSVKIDGAVKQYLYTKDQALAGAKYMVCATTTSGEQVCSCNVDYSSIPRSADSQPQKSNVSVSTTKGVITVEQSGENLMHIRLLTAMGITIFEAETQSAVYTLPFNAMGGAYIVSVQTDEGAVNQKVVLTK